MQRLPSVAAAIAAIEREFDAAELVYGHGTTSARDEAAWLVFAAVGLDHADAATVYDRPLSAAEWERVTDLARQRIGRRQPLAYLLNEGWFAGLSFYVDERVLVPRSPLAELIVDGFAPWLDDARLGRALDIGTGSGCIGIALAVYHDQLDVVATDVSGAALACAQINVERHGVQSRVRLVRSDVFDALNPDSPFDLIISNPPYVPSGVVAKLPGEYRREPQLGLAAGIDGLDVVRRIVAGAPQFLSADGILVVEVGESEQAVDEAFPQLPLTWLDMADGQSGVFLATRDDLERYRATLD